MSIDVKALDRLTADSVGSDATAALILQDGDVAWSFESKDYDPDELLHTASVTKFIVGMCAASAIYEGHIESIDQVAAAWLPERADDDRRTISLRHLMTHSSGLAVNWPAADDEERCTANALMLEPVAAPGTRVAYNNHGAQAVAEVIRRATGSPVDAYASTHIFEPLGISEWAWNHGGDGLPFGMSALQLKIRDLARIGELSLAAGEWRGRRIFAEHWGADRRPGTPFGLLEMLVPEVDVLVDEECSADLPAELQKVIGRYSGKSVPLNGANSIFAALAEAVGASRVRDSFMQIRQALPKLKFAPPTLQAHGHDGSGGQVLWVVPKVKGVAVRMRAFDDDSGTPATTSAFTELALSALLGGAIVAEGHSHSRKWTGSAHSASGMARSAETRIGCAPSPSSASTSNGPQRSNSHASKPAVVAASSG